MTFTEDERTHLAEVSAKWIKGKVKSGMHKASGKRGGLFIARNFVKGYSSKKHKVAAKAAISTVDRG
jgi:hypothetical protein